MISHLDSKLDTINQSLNKIEGSVAILGEHVTELEQRVSSNEDDVMDLIRVKTLENENSYLIDRTEAVGNCSRASNLRFISVPEKSEGSDIYSFMTRLIPQLLGGENFPAPPCIERCHRTPLSDMSNSTRPRPILVKFLHFQDNLKILKLSRDKNELVYNGSRIHIYPDFCAALTAKRRQFDPIKKKLRGLDFKYSLIFPCMLKVIHDGKVNLFQSPEDVEVFLTDLSTDSP